MSKLSFDNYYWLSGFVVVAGVVVRKTLKLTLLKAIVSVLRCFFLLNCSIMAFLRSIFTIHYINENGQNFFFYSTMQICAENRLKCSKETERTGRNGSNNFKWIKSLTVLKSQIHKKTTTSTEKIKCTKNISRNTTL